MRLGLGTVQLGLPYGATNQAGKPDHAAAGALLRAAQAGGFALIDTASTYGDSEEVLGACMPSDWHPPIITKTPPLRDRGAALATESLQRSLERLGRPVTGLLVHHAQDLLGAEGDALLNALLRAKESGSVRQIGVSVYNTAEIDAVLERFRPDIVQLPASLADRRPIHSGHVAKLAAAGAEVHCRSVLLQGMLLAQSASLHRFFEGLTPFLDLLDDWGRDTGKSRLALCLAFLMQSDGFESIILGAATAAEVSGLAAAAVEARSCPCLPWENLPKLDERLLSPVNWPNREQLLSSR
jgi:aryl-alcohol dehydrogenase-like predicted oxidoreductase